MRIQSVKNHAKTRNSNRRRLSLKRRPWLTCLIVLIIVALVVVGCVAFFNRGSEDKTDATGNDSADASNVDPKGEDKNKPAQKAVQFEGIGDDDAPEELSGYITFAGAADGVLRIRTVINQLDETSGSCDLTMTSVTGVTYTENTSIINDAMSATCYGYDIPVDQLEAGAWTIDILISANGKTGHIAGEVEL